MSFAAAVVCIVLNAAPGSDVARESCAPATIEIVDGATVRISQETLRLSGLDVPRPSGKCLGESLKGVAARDRLRRLLADAKVVVARKGTDSRGASLAELSADGSSVADAMVAAGLARKTGAGSRPSAWCRPEQITEDHVQFL